MLLLLMLIMSLKGQSTVVGSSVMSVEDGLAQIRTLYISLEHWESWNLTWDGFAQCSPKCRYWVGFEDQNTAEYSFKTIQEAKY